MGTLIHRGSWRVEANAILTELGKERDRTAAEAHTLGTGSERQRGTLAEVTALDMNSAMALCT